MQGRGSGARGDRLGLLKLKFGVKGLGLGVQGLGCKPCRIWFRAVRV